MMGFGGLALVLVVLVALAASSMDVKIEKRIDALEAKVASCLAPQQTTDK